MRWLWLVAGTLTAVPWAAVAQEAFDNQRLRQLVQAGRMAAAYAYASEHRPEHEGSPRFDLYYGIAAIDTGHLSEGVFALERVLVHQPGHDRARLELARGYYLLREDQRAREEFQAVLAHDPPPSVEAKVQGFLRAIRRRAGRYRTAVSGHVAAGMGYDSNVNSGPDAEEVAIFDGLLNLRLDDASRETADGFGFAEVAVNVEHPLTPAWGLYFDSDARERLHAREEDFNQFGIGASSGLRHRGPRHNARLGVRARHLEVGGRGYQNQAGLQGDFGYRLSGVTRVSTFAQAMQLRYPDSTTRDATLWTAGLGGSHRFVGDWYVPAVSLSLYGGQERPEENTQAAEAVAERDFYGASTGLRFFLHPEVTLRLRTGYRHNEYGAEQALFGKTREEDQYTALVAGDWRLRRDLRWRVALDGRRSESNIALYDYERLQVRTEIRQDFY